MRASYRDMFDEVRASGRLNEEVMNMTKQERTQVVKKISVSFIIAAALAVILAGTALAAAIGVPQTLQEWFNQQWTEAGGGEMPKEQAAVIESLVQPVGVTCINKGISITLDSITVEKRNICLLLKVKGEMLKGEWRFGDISFGGKLIEEAMKEEEGGISFSQESMERLGAAEDGTLIYLYKYSGGPKNIDYRKGGEMEMRLKDILLQSSIETAVPPGMHEEPIEVYPDLEARWVLPFTLEPVKDSSVLTAKNVQLNAESHEREGGKPKRVHKTFTIQEIEVTSAGYSFVIPEVAAMSWFDVPSLQLEGDVAIKGIEAMYDNTDLERQGSWELPVDLSKVESIRFGDVVIPLEQPKT